MVCGEAGEMQKCFLRSDETNYVLIVFLDRWCTHSSGIFRLGRVLEWIAGPKTWLVTVYCERILFWALLLLLLLFIYCLVGRT